MAGYSVSSGNQSSSSSGGSVFIPQPGLDYEKQWQQILQQISGQSYNWALDQYNKNSVLTDQMVHAATNYTSPQAIQTAIGAGEAGQEQAGAAAQANLKQQLQSYGINPGDPKYASALMQANAQTGAASAAAGNQARLAREATGFGMQQSAAAAQAQNLNAGVNALGVANNEMNAGVNAIKFAPLGNANQSQSQGSQQSHSIQSNPTGGSAKSGGGGGSSGGGGGGSSGGGGGGSSNGYSPYSPMPSITGSPFNYDNPGGGYQPGAGIYHSYLSSSGGGGGGGGVDTSGGGGGGDVTGSLGTSGGGPSGVGNGTDYGYSARGGDVHPRSAIPDGTTGGFVSHHLSPSGGAQTDDIPAALNAEEFVIPKDVVKWKGQEFFQKMIDQSRKARGEGSAKPTMKGKPAKPHMAAGGIPSGYGGYNSGSGGYGGNYSGFMNNPANQSTGIPSYAVPNSKPTGSIAGTGWGSTSPIGGGNSGSTPSYTFPTPQPAQPASSNQNGATGGGGMGIPGTARGGAVGGGFLAPRSTPTPAKPSPPVTPPGSWGVKGDAGSGRMGGSGMASTGGSNGGGFKV